MTETLPPEVLMPDILLNDAQKVAELKRWGREILAISEGQTVSPVQSAEKRLLRVKSLIRGDEDAGRED